MAEKNYISGCQIRQYLHISTRKMKYLMDHNYIPHENTGHTTHKYRVLIEDAEKFKFRMDNEIGFLAELNLSSKCCRRKKKNRHYTVRCSRGATTENMMISSASMSLAI